ncbi:hypothetical protein AALA79_02010 [Lachnospiraceae bacterium 64-25]
MSKICVFHLPSDPKDMIHKFNLNEVLRNTRTSIYQNEYVRFSIDRQVVRVLLYDDQNVDIMEKVRSYFYGEEYEKL